MPKRKRDTKRGHSFNKVNKVNKVKNGPKLAKCWWLDPVIVHARKMYALQANPHGWFNQNHEAILNKQFDMKCSRRRLAEILTTPDCLGRSILFFAIEDKSNKDGVEQLLNLESDEEWQKLLCVMFRYVFKFPKLLKDDTRRFMSGSSESSESIISAAFRMRDEYQTARRVVSFMVKHNIMIPNPQHEVFSNLCKSDVREMDQTVEDASTQVSKWYESQVADFVYPVSFIVVSYVLPQCFQDLFPKGVFVLDEHKH